MATRGLKWQIYILLLTAFGATKHTAQYLVLTVAFWLVLYGIAGSQDLETLDLRFGKLWREPQSGWPGAHECESVQVAGRADESESSMSQRYTRTCRIASSPLETHSPQFSQDRSILGRR